MDIDLVIRPESDALLRAIPALKEKLNLNVELAAPDHFIPVPPGCESRSPEIKRIGNVAILHYDFTAQALSKIERGHVRDLADVRAMLSRGLIARSELRAQYEQIEAGEVRVPVRRRAPITTDAPQSPYSDSSS